MVDEVNVHIGKKIREARLLTKKKGQATLTQAELGEAVGVSFQQIQKYENGSNRVSGSRLWKIAKFLDRPITFFFEGLNRGAALPVISDNALITAKMFHELPDGVVKKQVYSLIKSYHSESSGKKKTGKNM